MRFCGEGTADADIAAGYVRVWYERNREGWYDRWQRRWEGPWADEFMLWFSAEVNRVEGERKRFLAKMEGRTL